MVIAAIGTGQSSGATHDTVWVNLNAVLALAFICYGILEIMRLHVFGVPELSHGTNSATDRAGGEGRDLKDSGVSLLIIIIKKFGRFGVIDIII